LLIGIRVSSVLRWCGHRPSMIKAGSANAANAPARAPELAVRSAAPGRFCSPVFARPRGGARVSDRAHATRTVTR
jgi:hypothetical protein